MRCLQTNAVVRPFLWQVERTVDEGMAMPRHIASEYANLADRMFVVREVARPQYAMSEGCAGWAGTEPLA
jgi:hypothetical protein